MPTLTRRCPGTSAAVAPTCEFVKQSSGLRRRSQLREREAKRMFPKPFTSGATGPAATSTLSRRAVIKMGVVAGGGLTLGFRLPDLFGGMAEAASETVVL